MALLSLADYQAARKQRLPYLKGAGGNATLQWWPQAVWSGGNIGAAAAYANTANGIVPVGSVSGYPTIVAFASGTTGYLSRVEIAHGPAASAGAYLTTRFVLFDRLFAAGNYNFNDNVTLTSQPSFSGRLPNTDYRGLEIWVQVASTMTGALTATIGYTSDGGTTGRSTSVSIANNAATGSAFQVPLQAGDLGVSKIESVVGSVASAGTFSVSICRRLFSVGLLVEGVVHVFDLLRTGLPVMYDTSALEFFILNTPAAGASAIDAVLEIAEG